MSPARRIFAAFLLYAVLFLAPGQFVFSEEITQRVDGTVINVDSQKRILKIEFEHPVTGERTEKEFKVSADAGFKFIKNKNLAELKVGDLVSVDYLERGAESTAIYIIHVPLEHAYVTQGEVAQALLHMKPSGKKKKET